MVKTVVLLVIGLSMGCSAENASETDQGVDQGTRHQVDQGTQYQVDQRTGHQIDQSVDQLDQSVDQLDQSVDQLDQSVDQKGHDDAGSAERALPAYEVVHECPKTAQGHTFFSADFDDLNLFCRYKRSDYPDEQQEHEFFGATSAFQSAATYYLASCKVEGRKILCIPANQVETACEGPRFQACTVPNGKTDEGSRRRTCSDGTWGPPYGDCEVDASSQCQDGHERAGDGKSCCPTSSRAKACTVPNGKANTGTQTGICKGGVWAPPYTPCVVEDKSDCKDGYGPSDDKTGCVLLACPDSPVVKAGIPFYNNSVLSTNIEIKATRNKDGVVFESTIYWAGKPPFPYIRLEGCRDDIFSIQISKSPSNCTPYMHQDAPPIFLIDKTDRTKATFILASSSGVVTHIACTEED